MHACKASAIQDIRFIYFRNIQGGLLENYNNSCQNLQMREICVQKMNFIVYLITSWLNIHRLIKMILNITGQVLIFSIFRNLAALKIV